MYNQCLVPDNIESALTKLQLLLLITNIIVINIIITITVL